MRRRPVASLQREIVKGLVRGLELLQVRGCVSVRFSGGQTDEHARLSTKLETREHSNDMAAARLLDCHFPARATAELTGGGEPLGLGTKHYPPTQHGKSVKNHVAPDCSRSIGHPFLHPSFFVFMIFSRRQSQHLWTRISESDFFIKAKLFTSLTHIYIYVYKDGTVPLPACILELRSGLPNKAHAHPRFP